MSTSNFVGFGEAQRVSSRYVYRIFAFSHYTCVPFLKRCELDVYRRRTRVSPGLDQLVWRVGFRLDVDITLCSEFE